MENLERCETIGPGKYRTMYKQCCEEVFILSTIFDYEESSHRFKTPALAMEEWRGVNKLFINAMSNSQGIQLLTGKN
jgi:hypothetical protein